MCMQNLAIGGLGVSFASAWQKLESNSFAILQTLPWKPFEEKLKRGLQAFLGREHFYRGATWKLLQKSFSSGIQNIPLFLSLVFIGEILDSLCINFPLIDMNSFKNIYVFPFLFQCIFVSQINFSSSRQHIYISLVLFIIIFY